MPWCPECHCEYDKSVRVCIDCQCELVDELTANEQFRPIRESFLLTVADEMEYSIVESKLGEYGIPITKRYRGAGAVTQIYMGRTYGLDVYVPEVALPKAREILADSLAPDQFNETEQSEEYQAHMDFSKRGAWGRKIVLICVMMTLISLGFLAILYLISFLNLL